MSAAFARPGPRQLYGVNGTNSMEDKLKELDIPFLYVTDYLEESPLGKAESLLTLSEVIGKRVGCQTISNYLFVLMNSPHATHWRRIIEENALHFYDIFFAYI